MAITPVSLFSDEWTTLNSIQSANSASSAERADKKASSSQGTAFDTFLNAAVDMYKEADSLQKSAESAEMSYALRTISMMWQLLHGRQVFPCSIQ